MFVSATPVIHVVVPHKCFRQACASYVKRKTSATTARFLAGKQTRHFRIRHTATNSEAESSSETSVPFILIPVSCISYYFVKWQTNSQ
jgi:hypothetical protein